MSGPSGSGKSTTFHQISLLDKPTTGKIIIDGEEVTKLSEKEKTKFRLNKIGYVFQDYQLLPEMTALENVELPLMVNRPDKEEIEKRAEKILDQLGLLERGHHYPSELSGGEKQRVSIARALINNPDIILADEPTANLDSKASKNVMDIFKKLNKKQDKTIFMVNHETGFEDYFERVIRLKDGEIIES